MCGIAGYISLNKNFSAQQLQQAAAAMQHRGPDASGYYFSEDNRVGFAHRRLSILDLSTAANQPMLSADGRYCIVFNGEVYNFNELKQQLNDKGASLKTTSDTEVIVELFAQEGPSCFAALNGMFAFAVYDKILNKVTLCRDHVGIKPLFFYADENNIVFASELKVIKQLMVGNLKLNSEAIPYFLHLGYIPGPLTIYQQVYKFEAASYCEIDLASTTFSNTAATLQSFWSPEATVKSSPLKDERTAKEQLKTLLEDAVQKQMISDVPIGTFLSGGVDSSLVTAIASRQTPHKIKTFSIAIDNGKYNESKYAQAVAKTLNTEHHEFQVKEKEVMEIVDTLLPAYDEPYADPSAFPTMIVSKLARENVTVALSGDGGDELFMGYNVYNWAKRLDNPLMPLVRKPVYHASRLLNSRLQRAGQMFNYPSKKSLCSHVFSTEQCYFNEHDLNNILTIPVFDFSGLNNIDAQNRKLSAAENQSLWDFKSYLKDELLVKVDRASMQYSLETRVPLLDYRVASFAFNLDESLKINKKGVMKYLLKEVLYDYLPKQIFDRPKWGFSIPLSKWLKSDLSPIMNKYTSKEIVEKYNVVQYEQVAAIKKDYLGGKDFLYGRIWLLMILHWWLDENQL